MKRSRIGSSRASKQRRAERVAKDAAWSKAVQERDNYTCQRCHYRDEENNHAHHIAPRSQRPDLVHVLSNGATTCPLCHTWIHNHPIQAREAGLLSTETYELAQKNGRQSEGDC